MSDNSSYTVFCHKDDFIDKAAKIFNEFGFVVLKKSTQISNLASLKEDIDKAIKGKKIKESIRNIHYFENGEVSSAHNLSSYIPSYDNFRQTNFFKQFVEKAFGSVSNMDFNSSYFAKPKKIGIETKPHQDNAFFCMKPPEIATFWFPLSFASVKNGALYYYPLSHQLGDIDHAAEGNLGASMCLNYRQISRIEKKFNRYYIDLKAGDCVVHNSQIVHGSEENTSNYDRNALNFSLASQKAQRDVVLYSNYQKRLENFIRVKKGC